MQVSFVVPLYNRLDLTRPMLASLRATLPRDLAYEIILVDDGSTDGTRDWLTTLSAPYRVLLHDTNRGYAAANNHGAAVASGERLALLNNDLLLTPHWFEPLLAAHHRLGGRAGVIGNVQLDARTGRPDHTGMFINLQAKPEHDRRLPPRWWRRLRPIRPVPAVTGACALLGREVWHQLGGFDEGFLNGGEDVDLCLRARSIGRVNAVAWRSVILHHVSSSPGRKRRDEQNSRRLALRWRHELQSLACRRWCWDYLERGWTSPHAAQTHAEARRALAYALHLRRQPPAIALAGMHAAMDEEIARWDRLLR